MRGFTLIEIVISVAILAGLLSVTIPFFRDFRLNQEIEQTAQTLKTDIRFAQSRALGGVKDTICASSDTLIGWYVRIEGNGYKVLFRCLGVPEFENKSITLPAGMSLGSSIDPNGLLFRPVNKNVAMIDSGGTVSGLLSDVTFTLAKGSKTATVTIRRTGDIL